ncbi:hypothetical protein ASE55_12765 [Chryseobacterium sp. Leaf201]|nr:hypothetical protein ASE55_12765 [Chryseobacterium sp. Leaf201]
MIFLGAVSGFTLQSFFQKGFPLQSGLKYHPSIQKNKTDHKDRFPYNVLKLLFILQLIVDIMDQPVCH